MRRVAERLRRRATAAAERDDLAGLHVEGVSLAVEEGDRSDDAQEGVVANGDRDAAGVGRVGHGGWLSPCTGSDGPGGATGTIARSACHRSVRSGPSIGSREPNPGHEPGLAPIIRYPYRCVAPPQGAQMKVGVPRETLPGEHRVALVPDVLPKLKAAGIDVLVERGAGAAASYPDAMYEEAGATLVSGDEAWGLVDCVVKVQKPTVAEVGRLRSGQALVGLLSPLIDPDLMADARGARRHRDQPRRDPAHALARAVDGRPLVAGEHRRLQGRPRRRRGVRALLPAPDDGGRHGEAGERADPRDRRGRPPGDRHGPPPRRRREGVRRPPGDEGAGRVARRPVRDPQDRRSTRPAPAATPAS